MDYCGFYPLNMVDLSIVMIVYQKVHGIKMVFACDLFFQILALEMFKMLKMFKDFSKSSFLSNKKRSTQHF